MITIKTAAIGVLVLALLVPAAGTTPARAQEAPQLQKCLAPYQEATVTNAVTPEYPSSALSLGRFTVLVQVSLSATGQVVGASIYKTSGNADADRAALVAAHQSTFQARISNCVGQSTDYIFRADFVPPKGGAGVDNSNASCTTPDHSIKVLKRVLPVIPASLKESEGSFQAVVDVKVDAQGNVVAASIAQSTGNADVDQAILTAAQKTTYLPPIENCKPVAGEAWFHAGFGPKPTPPPGN